MRRLGRWRERAGLRGVRRRVPVVGDAQLLNAEAVQGPGAAGPRYLRRELMLTRGNLATPPAAALFRGRRG